MYKHYYVNNNQTNNPGLHHEVHTEEHKNQLGIKSTTYLGYFASETDAVAKAKTLYADADGCLICCPNAHRGDIMARKTHHVVPNPNGGWDVKRGGAERASGHYERKIDAIDAGRKISINQGTEFVIHGANGRIQSSDSHGNDPFPPKG